MLVTNPSPWWQISQISYHHLESQITRFRSLSSFVEDVLSFRCFLFSNKRDYGAAQFAELQWISSKWFFEGKSSRLGKSSRKKMYKKILEIGRSATHDANSWCFVEPAGASPSVAHQGAETQGVGGLRTQFARNLTFAILEHQAVCLLACWFLTLHLEVWASLIIDMKQYKYLGLSTNGGTVPTKHPI